MADDFVKMEWNGELVKRLMRTEMTNRVRRALEYVAAFARRNLGVANLEAIAAEKARKKRARAAAKAATSSKQTARELFNLNESARTFKQAASAQEAQDKFRTADVLFRPGLGKFPKRITGQLRRSIEVEMNPGNSMRGRWGTNVIYGKLLEIRAKHPYPWMSKTILWTMFRVKMIIAKQMQT